MTNSEQYLSKKWRYDDRRTEAERLDDALIETAVQAALDAGVAVNGGHGVAAARVAARHMLKAVRNPCDKIFDHKWLDPLCVEGGCQSLTVLSLKSEIETLRSRSPLEDNSNG